MYSRLWRSYRSPFQRIPGTRPSITGRWRSSAIGPFPLRRHQKNWLERTTRGLSAYDVARETEKAEPEANEDEEEELLSVSESEALMHQRRIEREAFHLIRNIVRLPVFPKVLVGRFPWLNLNGVDVGELGGLFIRTRGSELPFLALRKLLDPSTVTEAKKYAAMEIIAEDYASFLEEYLRGDQDTESEKSFSEIPPELHEDERLIQFLNLTEPYNWYPLARSIPRKVIIHVGPTNSGKTYNAIKALKEAKSGVYCGPLRLLAWEVSERLNADGIPCSLYTGQEKMIIEDANHYASTVELVDCSRRLDVAVIDEMQMISNSSRGWAWTNALLGVAAKEGHICGDPSMVDIVEDLCMTTGDEVQVNWYHRKTSLSMSKALGGMKNLRAGDALIAFSRKKIHSLKKHVEENSDFKCCVVYGSLPPYTRKKQAQLFNDTDSGFDVLIASDAIGMGLNLNIGRVIFSAVEKYDGEKVRPLRTTEALQIGGRAGRFGTKFDKGFVTTLTPENLKILREIWKGSLNPVARAGLAPPKELLTEIQEARPEKSLREILEVYQKHASVGDKYFIADLSPQQEIAQTIEDIDLQWEDRLIFLMAPIKIHKDAKVRDMFRQFAFGTIDNYVPLDVEMNVPLDRLPRTEAQVQKLETLHEILDAYLWLGNKIGEEVYVDLESARQLSLTVSTLISDSLEAVSELRNAKKASSKNVNERKSNVRDKNKAEANSKNVKKKKSNVRTKNRAEDKSDLRDGKETSSRPVVNMSKRRKRERRRKKDS
mmetsp:Transcript_13011/g.31873  ORF Transcript_13011/g.31873 Transcript_13011/m.31873 type:complete len:770 (-) Transcript_13011:62-2371(-)